MGTFFIGIKCALLVVEEKDCILSAVIKYTQAVITNPSSQNLSTSSK